MENTEKDLGTHKSLKRHLDVECILNDRKKEKIQADTIPQIIEKEESIKAKKIQCVDIINNGKSWDISFRDTKYCESHSFKKKTLMIQAYECVKLALSFYCRKLANDSDLVIFLDHSSACANFIHHFPTWKSEGWTCRSGMVKNWELLEKISDYIDNSKSNVVFKKYPRDDIKSPKSI